MRNVSSYAWSFIGKIGPQAIYLIATVVLAHFLTPADFGKIGVLAIFISIANTLNDSGLSGSLIKEKNITDIDCSTINVFNMIVSSSLYIILFICAPLIQTYFKTEGLSSIARCLGLVFLINSVSTVPKALLTRNLKYKTLTGISLIGVITASIAAIICGILEFGAYSLVIYQLLLAMVTSILAVKCSKFKFILKFSKKSFRKLLAFGVFTTLCNIIDNIYENLLSFLFGKVLNMTQTGYFVQAKKLEDASISAGKDTINSVSFPVLTRLRDDKEVFVEETKSIYRIASLLILPLLLFIVLYSKEVITLIFGNQWIESASYLSWLFIAGYFMIAESLTRNYVKALGNVGKLLKYTFFKRIIAILLIVVVAFTIPNLLLPAYIFGSIIGCLANMYLYSKLVNLNFYKEVASFLLTSLPSIILIGLCFVGYRFSSSVVFSICISVILYIVYAIFILPIFNIRLISIFHRDK